MPESNSRRKFLEKYSKVALSGSLAAITFNKVFSSPKPKEMFIHHVYFWAKSDATEEETKRFLEGLNKLKKIETIKTTHIGIPASTNRPVIDASYSYSLLLIFDNLADQNIYQQHPIHLKFVEECKSYWSKVIVYDSVNI